MSVSGLTAADRLDRVLVDVSGGRAHVFNDHPSVVGAEVTARMTLSGVDICSASTMLIATTGCFSRDTETRYLWCMRGIVWISLL